MQFSAPPWTLSGGVLHGRVEAVSSIRGGGASQAPYDSLNLGLHVGDDPEAVALNRTRLCDWAGLNEAPLWLSQVHATRVIEASDWRPDIEADGIICREHGQVGAIMTADCLPVLIAADDGSAVAAVHAGWRGLAAGVLANAVAQIGLAPNRLLAWIGPGISQARFEVGDEVRDAFVADDHRATNCFVPNARGRWQADLKLLAMLALRETGVVRITDVGHCTYYDEERYFSHRRSAPCGRMATLIWMT